MVRSLLVPLDGSPFGEHALPLAIDIARRARATVHLVHVHPPLGLVYPEGLPLDREAMEARIKRSDRAYLETLACRVQALTGAPVLTSLLQGEVATLVRQVAEREGVDLVALTTHGRGAFGRFWLGSTAQELIGHLPMPTLVLRPGDGPPRLESPPAVRHVLVPLDGSALAERVLEPALKLGALLGAEFTLLRVVNAFMPPVYPTGDNLEAMTEALLAQIEAAHQELSRQALEYLDGVATRFRARDLRVKVDVQVADQPASAILHEAGPGKADLIAMATHGRRGLTRLLLGSVADKVLRGSRVPLLLYRPAA